MGDPIEAGSIGAVLARGRRDGDPPVWLGSVKTNLGHLEAAAGVAGLVKAALVLRHRRVPPNLHFRAPNPAIDFDGLGLRVPTALEPLDGAGPLVASVNSFGFGGANATVILEEAPTTTTVTDGKEAPEVLALAALAGDLAAYVAETPAPFPKNVSPSLARERDDVLLLEGGLVRLPRDAELDVARNLPNLLDVPLTRVVSCREVYGRFAEVLTLAATGHRGHYGLGRADPVLAKDIAAKTLALGLALAPLQFFGEPVTGERLARVRRATAAA